MTGKVKVVTWITDGYPVVTVYETSVSDDEIFRLMSEAYTDVPDVDISEHTVYNKAVV